MQLTALLTVALTTLSLTSAAPHRRASPALSWQVANFHTGCSPGGCIYNFNITGTATDNTPGFRTSCSGSSSQDDYAVCADKHVQAKLIPELYPLYNVHVQHMWRHGEAEFYAHGQANVTSYMSNFTIPVAEVYGVA